MKHSRISPALKKVAERGLMATEEDVRGFVPGRTDLAIMSAMLGGAITFKEIAGMIDVSPATVSQHLQDPVMCAWTSRMIHRQVSQRLGMIDAAMYKRALGGCVRAAETLYKRYGQSADIKLNVNVGNENFDLMSNEALDALIARRTGEKTIDVDATNRPVEETEPGKSKREPEAPEEGAQKGS